MASTDGTAYTDADIYGRGLDGVFGSGAENLSKKNALLQLKAERDSKMRRKGRDFIEYDLYGRADPRVFGRDAHKINAAYAAEVWKTKRSGMLKKQSLRTLLFPFGKSRGQNQSEKKAEEGFGENRNLEAIDDTTQRQEGTERPASTDEPTIGPAGVETDNFANRTEASFYDSSVEIIGGRQLSGEIDDLGIASVAEVSSPEASLLGSSQNGSSDSDVPQSTIFSWLVQARGQSKSITRADGEEVPYVDSVQREMITPVQQRRPSEIPTDAEACASQNSILAENREASADFSPHASAENPEIKPTVLPKSYSGKISKSDFKSSSSSSASSVGIEAVPVTDKDLRESPSHSIEESVSAYKNYSPTNSGSFAVPSRSYAYQSNAEIGEGHQNDVTLGHRGVELTQLFGTGSTDSSQSDATASQPSETAESDKDDCPEVIMKTTFVDAVPLQSNETEHMDLNESNARNSSEETDVCATADLEKSSNNDRETMLADLSNANTKSLDVVAEAQNIETRSHSNSRKVGDEAITNALQTLDSRAPNNSSLALESKDGETEKHVTLPVMEDELTVEEAVANELETDNSEDEFVDALDSLEDSDQSSAMASSSEVVSSSDYSTGEDSDEIDSSANSAGSGRGSSAALSNNKTRPDNNDPLTEIETDSLRFRDQHSLARSRERSGSAHTSLPVSLTESAKKSSDSSESSFYSQVFESTVVDEDDNSDVFLVPSSTPNESLP